MSIALGVHVGVEEVVAVLVEAERPELRPVSTRFASVAAAPGGVGDAVTTMLGIMRVQAARIDRRIVGSAVVCDSIALCGVVRGALAAHGIRDVAVVDAGDPRLEAEVSFVVAAALFGTAAGGAGWRGELSADGPDSGGDVGSLSDGDRTGTRGARLTMIGLGVAVLAALSGATVWALAATGPEQSGELATPDVSVVAETPSQSTVVADPTATPPSLPSAPPVDEPALEVSTFGPVPVSAWNEPPPAGIVPTPVAEAASNTGGYGGGGEPDRVSVGGGGDSPDDDEAGGERTPTKDPKPGPKPGPEPEPESPDTDATTPTPTPEPNVEVPVPAEPPSNPESPTTEPTVN